MNEMKKFYEKYVLPKIINCACGTKPILIQRQKIVPSASGVILEIGVGSGVNIPYYSHSNVKKLIGLDLQQDNWDQAYKIAKKTQKNLTSGIIRSIHNKKLYKFIKEYSENNTNLHFMITRDFNLV